MGARELATFEKRYLVGMLEIACEKLDITDTERREAESRYNAVGKWLSDGDDKHLASSATIVEICQTQLCTNTKSPIPHNIRGESVFQRMGYQKHRSFELTTAANVDLSAMPPQLLCESWFRQLKGTDHGFHFLNHNDSSCCLSS